MRPTVRALEVGGLALVLVAAAIVFAQPLALFGAVLLGGWLLAHQYSFVQACSTVADAGVVTQETPRGTVHTDTTTPVTLTVSIPTVRDATVTVSGGLPVGATADSLECHLPPGTTEATEMVEVTWPIAGRHQFERPTVHVTDGLFEQTFPLGSAPRITVEPRTPQRIHVGAGGDQVPMGHGVHGARRGDAGLLPVDLREYLPGDSLSNVDWKATARLATPYVRTYQSETDRPTLVFIDHSSSMGRGPDGETQLDYLREVALATAESAARLEDPVGLYTVSEQGLTASIPPSTWPIHDHRKQLLTLEALPGNREPTDPSTTITLGPAIDRTPARAAQLLTDGSDAFAATLRPFYTNRAVEKEPDDGHAALPSAVRSVVHTSQQQALVVVLTDDTDPKGVRRSVRTARDGGHDVLLFLTPTVLFEPGGLTDLEAAYDRYLDFERFRKELDRLDGVTALEVGPRDRITSVLATASRRRGGASA